MPHPRTARAPFLAALMLLAPAAATAQEQADKSGTNPTVFQNVLALQNEYQFQPGDRHVNNTLLRLTRPFGGDKFNVRLTAPLISTNLSGREVSGNGDLSAKVSWLAHVDMRQGVVLSTELFTPTASDRLGSGKWILAPGITWAKFVSPRLIVAPAYVHSVSVAGDGDRNGVNRGDFDLYVVYKFNDPRTWITSDLTMSRDFKNDRSAASWEVSLGRNLGRLSNGAAINGYVRPGVGLGNHRSYDANIEVGLSMVGF